MSFTSTFYPESLRLARARAKLTQAQLAQAVGCRPSVISRYECGDQVPRAIRLLAIANALDVHLNDLLDQGPGDQSPEAQDAIIREILVALDEMTPSERAETLAGILRLREQKDREHAAEMGD